MPLTRHFIPYSGTDKQRPNLIARFNIEIASVCFDSQVIPNVWVNALPYLD